MNREIMQQALDALNTCDWDYDYDEESYKTFDEDLVNAAAAALEAELAKPEQEPVAWHHPDCAGVCLACLIDLKVHEEYGQQGLDYLRKRVQTPRKPWVGLTVEDQADILDRKWWNFEDEFDLEGFLRVTEAKLKEKNNAV